MLELLLGADAIYRNSKEKEENSNFLLNSYNDMGGKYWCKLDHFLKNSFLSRSYIYIYIYIDGCKREEMAVEGC